MKKYWIILISICLHFHLHGQSAKISVKEGGVVINNTGTSVIDPTAVLDISSINKGVLFPRLTTSERDSIVEPAEGLLVYNKTTHVYEFFNGTEWMQLGITSTSPPAPATFVSKWKTNNPGSSSTNQITLPLESTGTYNFEVNWGDGSTSIITSYNQPEVTHTYSNADTYTVSITGTINGWRFNNDGDEEKLTEISAWGDLMLGNNGGYFYGASNLVITATDIVDTSLITNFSHAWSGCSSLSSFPLIDTRSGTIFSNAWRNCSSLTSFPLLDTSSGTDFSSTWADCSSLTSFPSIDTGAGVNFSSAWQNCSSLPSFPELDVSSGTSFSYSWAYCSSMTSFLTTNTNSGVNFYMAFRGASSLINFPSLNTSLATNFGSICEDCTSLISFPVLNTSSVTNFRDAWRNCSSLTAFPLLNTSSGTDFRFAWSGCSSLTSFPTLNLAAMSAGASALSGTNIGTLSYSNLLTAIESNNTNNNVAFHGGNATYNSSGQTAKDALVLRGWTITDGGAN